MSPPLVSHFSGCRGPHEFPLVSQSCLPDLSPALGCLGCMSVLPLVSCTCFLHLSPLDRMSLQLAPVLVSDSECFGPYGFTLVPNSGCHGPYDFTLIVSHLSPACLPRLSLTLGALDSMSLQLSRTCLPLWVPCAARGYACLPLISRTSLLLCVPWAS